MRDEYIILAIYKLIRIIIHKYKERAAKFNDGSFWVFEEYLN